MTSDAAELIVRQRLTKTRIVATVGPASESRETLTALVRAGVDIFRLNFAHGSHEAHGELVSRIREVEQELHRPIAILGDLSGPKIRLGEIANGERDCHEGDCIRFVRNTSGDDVAADEFTCTYDSLIDDVRPGDRILLADGTVGLVVVDKDSDGEFVQCRVTQPGKVRSRQGVNLPGVPLSTPSVTEKDRADLAWAISHDVDFVGLSFVRSGNDIQLLKTLIAEHNPAVTPLVVAKIEKTEAIDDLTNILLLTDAVMVARGDLGVEAEISRVPVLQKQIIRSCNDYRIPVITATQMLDSMQSNDLPTRAEVTDVANAVIDGSDAVMLSGETAIGHNPVRCVRMMDNIAAEAEPLVPSAHSGEPRGDETRRARPITEAITRGAIAAADYLQADLIVVATLTGRTALALSRLRSPVPILAVTEKLDVARRMCLYWGVTSVLSEEGRQSADALLEFVTEWGMRHDVLHSGSKVILVGHAGWLGDTHDLCMVHVIP
jgi:pyruvate kinase